MTVKVDVPGVLPEIVTEGALKVAEEPLGNPLTVKLTVPLKLEGVSVMV